MVFTLVSAGQEWLNEKWDNVKKEREEQILAKQKADEEAEMVCSLYTSKMSSEYNKKVLLVMYIQKLRRRNS